MVDDELLILHGRRTYIQARSHRGQRPSRPAGGREQSAQIQHPLSTPPVARPFCSRSAHEPPSSRHPRSIPPISSVRESSPSIHGQAPARRQSFPSMPSGQHRSAPSSSSVFPMARPEHRPPTSDAGVCPPDQQHLRLFFHPPFVRQTRHHLDWTASKIWQQASITHLANKRQATAVGFETQPLQWTTDVSRPLFGNQIKTQPAVQGKNRTYHIQPWAMAAIISHPSSDDVHGKSSSAHHRRLRAGISDLGSEIQSTTSRSPNQKANSNSDPTATPRAERENSHRQQSSGSKAADHVRIRAEFRCATGGHAKRIVSAGEPALESLYYK